MQDKDRYRGTGQKSTRYVLRPAGSPVSKEKVDGCVK